MKIVSACLAGVKCRYNGSSCDNKQVIELVKQGKVILVCPEQLAGLTTPRPPVEIKNNKVFTKDKKDLTRDFQKGAEEALKIVKLYNCKEAILKAKSPSCGCGKIYDGNFTGKLIDGNGVFTKLLKKQGIKTITEEDLQDEK